MGCLHDGIETRRLLSRLLLGIDGSSFCLWRDEPVMGRQYQRVYPVGEDHASDATSQPPWRPFVHRMGSMDFFWLARLTALRSSAVSLEISRGLWLREISRPGELML